MSRFNLPDIEFFNKNPEDIERDILFFLEEKGFTLSNADPRRKFVQSLVSYIALERNNLDYAIKQNLLAYAEDEHLDHQGEGMSTPRLEPKSASTIMEFTLEQERVSALTIEAGTLFLVGETFFETSDTSVAPVGQNSIQVTAICTETGDIGNGYLPGEISTLVNPLPWVKSVKNVTTSNGGADLEENDSYAEESELHLNHLV